MKFSKNLFSLFSAIAIVGILLILISCGGGGGGNGGGGNDNVAQTTVTGTVLDINSNPISGAQVTITSDPVTVFTDIAGYFSAEILAGNHNIEITINSVVIYSGNFTCFENTPYDFDTIFTQHNPDDIIAPSIPTGLTAIAASSSQINLSWNPSTDNVGATGYEIYRDGVHLTSLSNTSMSDTGLIPETEYCYAVSAVDAAGNESEQSVQTCATTLSDVGPVLEITPPALDFGAVTIGNTPFLDILVQNTGYDTLNITNVIGPSAPYLVILNDCNGAALLPANICTIRVQFTPTASGVFSDSVQIQSNAGNQTVNITGTGQAASTPQILVTPTTVNFGTVNLGSSTTSNVQVQNIGTADLNVTFVGSFTPSVFSLDSNGCTLSVAPGNTCDISVRFTPAADTTYNGSFEINSNGGNQTVNLSGTGPTASPAQISVSPTTVNFGTVNLGSSTTSNVQVQNIGTADLNVTFVGSFSPSAFSLDSNGCTSLVAPGNTCDISVRFTPTISTAYSGSFEINSNGGNQIVNLTGIGQAIPTPQISVSPTIVNFGTVNLGTSTTSNVQVQNIGTANLNVTFVGSFTPTEFSLNSNGCTSPVAPGSICNISVRFAPAADITYTGSFQINSDGGNQTVNLSGTGQVGGGGGDIDLEPTYIKARAPYLTYIYRGTTRIFDYKVRNNGSDPSGTIRIKAYYSLEDEVLDGSDMEIANFTISSIGGGAESSLVLSTVTPWNLQVHSVYYLILVVDPDDSIQETNENNNTITHGGLVKG